MTNLLRDLRYALRSLSKNPGFATAAILSLAIGIGANTSIFSIISALLLRPLPYKDANRLVIVWNRSPGLGISQDWFSTAQYFDIKNGHSGFEDVAIAYGTNDNVTGNGDPERIGTIRISSNLLPMLGYKAGMGRLFLPDEDIEGHNRTALLSYGTWTRRFGADPHILGKSITINGASCEIVGVLPESFSLPREVMPTLYGAENQAEILLPFPMPPDAAQNRDHEDYNIVGKLKSDVTVAQAQTEMDTLSASLRRDHPQQYPPNGGLTFGIVPLQQQVLGDARGTLLMLLGAVACVLLIACANVANLLLSRAVARQKEIALRTALGASGRRIIRQLLTESILLALCGGALGIAFSILSVHWIRVLGPKSVPRLSDIGVDREALLFTLSLSVFSGILFGLAPALRAAQFDLHSALSDGTRGSAATGTVWGRGNNLRRFLVISELALSVILLVAAGLLIRSFAHLENASPGFNPKDVLTLELATNGRRYKDGPAVLATYRQLNERFERIPGVSAAGSITSLPLSEMFAWGPITIEGRIPPPGENFLNADERIVSGHYFEAMQIPLRRGRFFSDLDTPTTQKVAIVDEYLAQQYWANEDPIGKRIRTGGLESEGPWLTIVGVVGRIKQDALDSNPRIAFYLPHSQYTTPAMNVVLRSEVTPAALTSAIKKEIHEVDPDLPIYNVRTMDNRVQASLARRRFSMVMLSLFAFLALALATIGIYGVMAYAVSQGTREIGIRLALGATPSDILWLVVRQGMILAMTGVTLGLLCAFALTHLIRSLLFGVRASDPLTLLAIAGLLAGIALVASYIPARRAARTDPMVSLRCE
ncbi:MAG: ABC transporter permease [Candidatus Acidiferrales bacterium]